MKSEAPNPVAAKDRAPVMGPLGQTVHTYGDQRDGYAEPGTEGAKAVECLKAQGALTCETNPEGPTGA